MQPLDNLMDDIVHSITFVDMTLGRVYNTSQVKSIRIDVRQFRFNIY